MKPTKPTFGEIILTTSEGVQIKVFTEEETKLRIAERFWLNFAIVTNMLITGFMVGFAVAYFEFYPKNFLGID